jgi:putative hemolysin
MMIWEWWIAWAMLVLTFAASALASGMEIGSYAVNRVRLDLRSGRTPPDDGARILAGELRFPARLLATLLISNNIVNAIAAEATSSLLTASGYGNVTIAIINTLVLGPLLFVLGDAVPKELFRVEADRLMPLFSRALRLVRVLLTIIGILPLVRWVTSLLERLLKLPRNASDSARERMAMLLKEGAGHGVLSESQVSLLDRALAFRDVKVEDEMVEWRDVIVLPASGERSRMLDLVAGSTHTFFPLVDRTGRVIGVLRHLDLYTQTKRSPHECVQSAVYVRVATPAREAMAMLHRARSKIAIVVDASDRPLGIVTARDLVRPLTGDLAGL